MKERKKKKTEQKEPTSSLSINGIHIQSSHSVQNPILNPQTEAIRLPKLQTAKPLQSRKPPFHRLVEGHLTHTTHRVPAEGLKLISYHRIEQY